MVGCSRSGEAGRLSLLDDGIRVYGTEGDRSKDQYSFQVWEATRQGGVCGEISMNGYNTHMLTGAI